ncbi:DUF5024 domain-containing protein [Parabacteroides sp. OttesenSCG-928-N08]|nr:DUF5024 domain-containing protein [Parabacteroides sp. OttesenSCG-928-N08]
MKTGKLVAIVILLITSSISIDLMAQENILAVVRKAEKIEGVRFDIVRKKNPETKQLVNEITSLSFRDNEALKKEFLDAFEKDRANADNEIEGRNQGVVTELMYKFGSTSCAFNIGKNGSVDVAIIVSHK